MENCIFCKIITGEIPSFKVYEDEQVLAFLDINPVNPGHTLVLPKKHVENIEEADEETLCKVIKTIKKVGLSLKKNLAVLGYNVQVNNDPVAGQAVPHLHFHVTPRLENDGLKLWPQKKYKENQAEEILNKIKIK
ncbi:MAG: HIT family protein [Candidatus Falkowbacteria bacterium]